MKTVIEMALNSRATVKTDSNGLRIIADNIDIEKFAELVRADEREKYKWDVHSCGPNCTKVACVAMREAVEAEREACAQLCEDQWQTAHDIQYAIRARGNT